jgi:hypothetical protein
MTRLWWHVVSRELRPARARRETRAYWFRPDRPSANRRMLSAPRSHSRRRSSTYPAPCSISKSPDERNVRCAPCSFADRSAEPNALADILPAQRAKRPNCCIAGHRKERWASVTARMKNGSPRSGVGRPAGRGGGCTRSDRYFGMLLPHRGHRTADCGAAAARCRASAAHRCSLTSRTKRLSINYHV